MMKRWLAAFAVTLIFCGLPGAAATQRAQGVDRPAADLQFDYQFGIGEGERRVAVPTGLSSGDRFVVRLKSNQPAFACLFVTDGSGRYTLMRPDDGDEPCARVGRSWAVLPDREAVMRLDENEGVERIYLIVSDRPVVEVEDLPADGRVSESWLVALRDRYGRDARRRREVRADSVSVRYEPGASGLPVAVEELTFNHR